MKKITLFVFLFLSLNQVFSQPLYNRIWGATVSDLTKPLRIAEVRRNTEELYTVRERDNFGYIYVYNKNNSTTSTFYKFPHPNPLPSDPTNYSVRIENIKFDSSENLIVYGRTHNANLGTSGTYSQIPLNPTIFTGHSFIAKISRSGQLVWLTYFHDLAQNSSSLAIDKNNNIYVLSKRNKNDVVSQSTFQSIGDQSSNINYQEVISKLDTNGKHIWSTFYFKDNSVIRNIEAGDNGIYVYGDYMGSNSSNYFGTKGSYQEYSFGMSSNGNSSTAFITKFNFNGTRIWSSYFGEQISKCPVNSSYFPYGMMVIEDDVYFLTDHKTTTPTKSIATSNAYLTTPVYLFENTTLTKFTSDGKRSFTTYLYTGKAIQKTNNDDIFITGETESSNSNLNSLITQNAYQKQHGGKSDIYTYILSKNGSNLKYGSFYGYDGTDSGIAITSENGFYIFGNSLENSNAKTSFDTNGGMFSGSNINGYSGNFISYFTTKPLSNKEFNKLNINMYPNPTTDILNIQTEDILPENTTAIVYDVNGKRVLNIPLKNSNMNKVNVSHLSSGVYILQISGNKIDQTFKFIKK